MAKPLSLEYDIQVNAESGMQNDAVIRALKLIKNTVSDYDELKSQWDAIQDLHAESFQVYNPKGTKKVTSKLLAEILWRTVNKMKMLDFTIHGVGVSEEMERLVTAGISTVLDKSGYMSCLRDKNGVFYGVALFGDFFMRLGTSEKGFPIKFSTIPLTNIRLDPQAIGLRDQTSDSDCNEVCIIYRYSWDQYRYIRPDWWDKVSTGEIPKNFDRKKINKTVKQSMSDEDPYIEEAHYYNLAARRYTIFAGANCTVVQDLEGEEYPFEMDGDCYIPISHYKFIPSTQGLYNYGLGHMFYDLSIQQRRLDNMAFAHAEDNVYPINIYNVPMGESSKFFNKMYMAHRQRAAGGKGYLVNELNMQNPNARTSIETLQTPPITGEYERMKAQIDLHTTRLGVQIDSVDRGTNVTATQIMSETENADSFLNQVMELNASQFKFDIEMVIDIIKKTVQSDNKIPLHLSTTIDLGNEGEQKVENVTLGDLADELRRNTYFVTINARSGVIPSNIMQQVELSRTIPLLQPGTPAFLKATRKFLQLNNQDFSLEDLQQAQPQQAPTEKALENVDPSQIEQITNQVEQSNPLPA